MEARVIRTEEQYHSYLSEVQELLSVGPDLSSEESERVDLLTVLIENFEKNNYPIEPPTPIEAIKFRMEERGLKQADLVPYFGTRSRVSEVLSGKRPLTIPMIRALSVGLGLSTEVLVGVPEEHRDEKKDIDWGRFPAKEMIARGWIDKVKGKAQVSLEEQVKQFVSQVGFQHGGAAFKRTLSGDAYSPATQYALYAWLVRVVQRSREQKESVSAFDENAISTSVLREIAQLSWFDEGPKLAVEYLNKLGINVVIEPHLKGTLLDGAALKDIDGSPIIGLTLRHDRLDNFWFTLLHEMVHIWKHVGKEETFLDDLDTSSTTDRREAEANRIAKDSLIPRVTWKRSEASRNPSERAIDELSRELRISPSIIAGRVRRETGNYRIFSDLVGSGEVKKIFFS
ncbi:MAG: ImmA/IrrE family metallo-endopeptidase [Pseudomonadota bacterium]